MPGASLFTPDVYVEAYRLARQGLSLTKMAEVLGVEYQTFSNWRKKYPTLDRSIAKGREEAGRVGGSGPGSQSDNWRKFIFNRLPKHLRKVWKRVNACDEYVALPARVEALLDDCGETGRKHLFLHALFHYNFDASRALRAVNVSRKSFERWVTLDPEFAELFEEMDRIKKDFGEAQLYSLIKAGSERAILFFNQTKNTDRGYGKTTKITVDKKVDMVHSGKIKILNPNDMSKEEKRKYLEFLRARPKQLPAHEDSDAKDAEFVPVKKNKEGSK